MTFHFLDDDGLGFFHGVKWAVVFYAVAVAAIAFLWWNV
jgi:UDP-N-acetylmuramyl pentapeptide phosphotransferase/UDP-N-acetylglucosamine-1-phosphate transferase